TPEIVRAWAEEDAPKLPDHDLDLIVSRSADVHDDIAEVWRPFAHAFADIVREPASVPPVRGVPTSTGAPVTDPAAIRAALAAEAHGSRAALPLPTVRPPGYE